MRGFAAAALLALAGCSRPAPPAAAPSTAPPPRITQFYSTTPQLARGEKGMVCYGAENAKAVWLSPPRRELSAALARCIEVDPTETTTYTLTAESAGATARQELTITLGAPKPKIIEVQVSNLDVKRGTPVSICYKVANASSVRIEPPLPPMDSNPHCGVATPQRTTTYTVTATSASGERDQEHVTVKVH
jgi:hypothetical protein